MPGIIVDPRQNDTEKHCGIAKIFGIYAYYTKNADDNDKRFVPFGWKINKAAESTNLVGTPNHYEEWNDMKIYIRVDFIPDFGFQDGEVTKKIFTNIKNNWQSYFPDPLPPLK